MKTQPTALATVLLSFSLSSHAVVPTSSLDSSNSEPEIIEVKGRHTNLVGSAISASQGLISQAEISIRPLLRTGEILETIPGLVVTQHSGTGKANQYFLRGFNLDHGTDFATFVDNMPVNMRTHGHGQGYSDLNFIIPEFIQEIEYKKGPYYAQVGDFSGAGSATMRQASSLERRQLSVSLGRDNYRRYLLTNQHQLAEGILLYAIERHTGDGNWSDINEDLNKTNGIVKFKSELFDGDFSITAMAYDGNWNSADQIPQRAVERGLIDNFGSIDPTVGGKSHRYSISSEWRNQHWQVSAYAIDYSMSLIGNFTYFMEDPLKGDQMEQVDRRQLYGANVAYQKNGELFGKEVEHQIGLELRYDDIDEVALYKTSSQRRLGAIRIDEVAQWSTGLFWQSDIDITDKLRSSIGLRYDRYNFDVASSIAKNHYEVDLTDNSGKASDDKLSFKFNLSYAIDQHVELYGSIGQGYHSNDARGTTVVVDAISGDALSPVDPLVGSLGYEVGLRSFWQDQFNLSLVLWRLELDSELIFVGDSGSTEPSGASKRQGLELTSYYYFDHHWTLDLEYSISDSIYATEPKSANLIPGTIDKVVQLGLSGQWDNGLFGSLRMRYFGKRPLTEDGLLNSKSSKVTNFRMGYRTSDWSLTADILNVLDSKDHDIDYYYESQLKGEAQPVADYHYHPLAPRSFRIVVSYYF